MFYLGKSRQIRQLLSLVITCLILIPCTLRAESVVVPTDDYPPWKIITEGKVSGGIDTLIIQTLLNKLNLTPDFTPVPWKRCLLMMQMGTGDLISGVTLTKERQKYLAYLYPPYKTKSQKVLYVRRGIGSSYQVLADLDNKRIGIIRGGKYFPSFDQNPAISKYEVDSDIQGMKMLMAGRLDGFLVTRENGEYLLQKHPEIREKLEMAAWSYNKKVEVYLAISKQSPLIAKKTELESHLKSLVDSGTIDTIIRDFKE